MVGQYISSGRGAGGTFKLPWKPPGASPHPPSLGVRCVDPPPPAASTNTHQALSLGGLGGLVGVVGVIRDLRCSVFELLCDVFRAHPAARHRHVGVPEQCTELGGGPSDCSTCCLGKSIHGRCLAALARPSVMDRAVAHMVAAAR